MAKKAEVKRINCPGCGARISYVDGEPPTSCVCCKLQFVDKPVAVIDTTKPEPTVVKVDPVDVSGKAKEVK